MLKFVYCSRREARATWQGFARDKDIPRSSKYAKVYDGDVGVGVAVWSGSKRVRIQWLMILPEHRGRNLQLRVRDYIGHMHAARHGRCAMLTYCNVWNLASMRNIIRSGGMPYRTTTDTNGAMFVHFKQEYTV